MNNATLSVTLPVLPIKRTVLFPGILMPVTVGRERSVAAVLELPQGSGPL